MPPEATPSLSVLLLDPRPVRCRRYLDSIEQTPGLVPIGHARDLMRAYDLTEHQQPDIVLVAEAETRRANFAMYQAMLSALEITCIILRTESGQASAPAGCRVASAAEIAAESGLGPYLAQRHGVGKAAPIAAAPATPRPPSATGWKTVVMGASTGGVEALIEILAHYQAECPPTMIVQHIGARFLPGLAQRLDRHCAAAVRPARTSDDIAPGLVLLAPSDATHLMVVPPGRRCRLVPGAPESGHRPSVDVLFRSAAALGTQAVGALLTGMGRDGAAGLAEIRRAGGITIAQDAASATVYGMPRAAQELGAVSRQLALARIGPAILTAAATGERAPHG